MTLIPCLTHQHTDSRHYIPTVHASLTLTIPGSMGQVVKDKPIHAVSIIVVSFNSNTFMQLT